MYSGKVPVMQSRQNARRRRVDRGQVNVVPLSTSKLQNGSAWLEFVRSFSFIQEAVIRPCSLHFTSPRLFSEFPRSEHGPALNLLEIMDPASDGIAICPAPCHASMGRQPFPAGGLP